MMWIFHNCATEKQGPTKLSSTSKYSGIYSHPILMSTASLKEFNWTNRRKLRGSRPLK
jgi:hypothetical protein